ncbi:hypothetical protein ACWEBX_40545 [Streptomyces sp. NPDC005070]
MHLPIERAAAAGAVVLCPAGSPAGHQSVRDVLRRLPAVARTVPHDSGDRAFAAEPTSRPTSRHIRLERLSPAEVTALAGHAGRRERAAFLYDSR